MLTLLEEILAVVVAVPTVVMVLAVVVAVVGVVKEHMVTLVRVVIIKRMKTLSRSGMFIKLDQIKGRESKSGLRKMIVSVSGVAVIIIGHVHAAHLNI